MFLEHFYKDSNSVFYALCDKNVEMNSNIYVWLNERTNIRKSKFKKGLGID